MLSGVSLLRAIWELCRGWIYILVLLLVVLVGLLVYRTSFLDPDLHSLQNRRADLQQQLKNRELSQQQAGVPVSALEQMERDLQTFVELVPEKEKFANFIGELFHLAEQSRLDIREISYQPKVDEETGLLNYGLSFSVQGTYEQIKRFVHLLENSKRLMIIDKIGLSGQRDSDNSSQVNLQINLTTFFQEGPE